MTAATHEALGAMTPKRRAVLDFMLEYQLRQRVPPTMREIADRFQFSPQAAHDITTRLERDGYIVRSSLATHTHQAPRCRIARRAPMAPATTPMRAALAAAWEILGLDVGCAPNEIQVERVREMAAIIERHTKEAP